MGGHISVFVEARPTAAALAGKRDKIKNDQNAGTLSSEVSLLLAAIS